MHTGDNHNDLTVDAIEDSIREPAEKRPPGVSMNHRILSRMRNHIIKRGLNGHQKLTSQPGTLPLVPEKCFIDIRRSRRTDK